jgi:anti-sigma B factor antagonist
MDIRIESLGDGIAALRPRGSLNMENASQIRDAVQVALKRGEPRIVLDLGEVDFMDSSSLGSIIGSLKSAREADGDLRLAAPSWQVKLVLQLTSMDRVFTVYDQAEEAYA